MRNHPLDVWLLRAINIDLAHPYLDPVMKFITGYTPWMCLGAVLLAWLAANLNRRDRWPSLIALAFAIAAVAATDAVCHRGMKIVHFRDWGRPCVDPQFPWVRLVAEKCGNWFTFPSNHAANSMCVATFWAWRTKIGWLRPVFLLIAVLIGFSRVYVGVHFPSDVLAGATIGALFGSIFYFLSTWVARKQASHHSALTHSS